MLLFLRNAQRKIMLSSFLWKEPAREICLRFFFFRESEYFGFLGVFLGIVLLQGASQHKMQSKKLKML